MTPSLDYRDTMNEFNKLAIVQELPTYQADVWITFPEFIKSQKLLTWYEELLDEDERNHYISFVHLCDRQSYLISHALLRTTLSRYCSIPPEEWQFKKSENGRPEIRNPDDHASTLRFSLSHTRGLSACIVTHRGKVGIDVEACETTSVPPDLAKRVLSNHEQRWFESLETDSAKRQYFLERWCLKEAFTKAIGAGLTIDFRSLTFYRDEMHVYRLKTEDRTFSDWICFNFWPTLRHCLAAAVFLPVESNLNIRILTVLPGIARSVTPLIVGE